jgi:short-subunit dehydrogenase
MVSRGRGGIINIASTSGLQPLPYTATYAASKAFVLYLTEALHAELRGTGVTATAVCPGPVPTAWSDISGVDHSEYVPTSIPASKVVADALRAYERGNRTVTPGLLNRVMMQSLALLPHAVSLPSLERMYRPTPDGKAKNK